VLVANFDHLRRRLKPETYTVRILDHFERRGSAINCRELVSIASAELVMGGGLARADNDRLGVFVPDAGTLDINQLTQREVHVWNPLRETSTRQ